MPFLGSQRPKSFAPVHPGGQVSQSSLAFVLVLYAHRPTFTGGQFMAATSGLNGGLLVGADHVLSLSKGLAFPPTLVEVQHREAFSAKSGSRGKIHERW